MHTEVCEKQRKKQRKVFDSSKQRTLVDANGDSMGPPPSSPMKKSVTQRGKPQNSSNQEDKDKSRTRKSNWREEHEEFIRTVRQARGEKVDTQPNATIDEAAGRKRIPVGYVECPFCERKFSKAAAERHIPWCKEQKARIPRTPNANASKDMTQTLNRKNKAKSRYAQGIPVKRSEVYDGKPDYDYQSSRGSEVGDGNDPVHNIKTTRANGVGNPIGLHQRNVPAAVNRRTNQRNRSPVRREAASKVKARLKMDEQANKHPKTPVMKFKEKFPNHVRSSLDSITSKFLQNSENPADILRKPDHSAGPMLPKTVPGVRTRGISPMRYDGKQLSLESEDLLRMKAQINNMYPTSKSESRLNFIDRLLGQSNGDISSISSQLPLSKSKSQENVSRKGREESTSTEEKDLPRFCHQCGTKYPGTASKFCHECGEKRLKTGGVFLAN